MKKILLVESDINFYNIYVLNLKTYLECQLELVQTLDQAINSIESESFDLILCRTKFLG